MYYFFSRMLKFSTVSTTHCTLHAYLLYVGGCDDQSILITTKALVMAQSLDQSPKLTLMFNTRSNVLYICYTCGYRFLDVFFTYYVTRVCF